MSSSSSSSSSASPEPPSKRKRQSLAENDETSESSDSESEPDLESDHEADGQTAEDDAPLSHAEKRRQKKKAKLAEKISKDEPAKKKRKLADGKAKTTGSDDKKHPPRQNSVWVGNLSFKTTPEALRAFFDGVGEITRINMPTKPSGKPGVKGENRGFAYVDFSTPDAKTVAIALSERPLNGRKLLIKDGDNFEGRPKPVVSAEESLGDQSHVVNKSLSKTAQKILSQQKKPPAPTLFIGNLPFETTEESLREMLDAHRPKQQKGKEKEEMEGEDWIRRIRLGTFEDTGVCKGFGFVDFSDIENATSALVNPKNHNFNGRKLVVEYASAEAVRRGPNKPKGDADGKPRTSGSHTNKHDRNDRQRKTDRGGRNTQHEDDKNGDADVGGEGRQEGETKRTKREFRQGEGPRRRPRPGAALAQAVRQSAAIVMNSNVASKKIVFE
ncbi:Nucleolar protein 13 [Stygiomarasmius scandens]|uniref:Nucleolar protein 13 n=1 Tax=Marasmiellus scandens TaxID=2682957 RepID=A0ABR1K110_9AGAR